jgi:hypothetical protein
LQIRTISAILAWVVVALLIANFTFKSELIILISIAIVIIAVLIYFLPRFGFKKPKKTHADAINKGAIVCSELLIGDSSNLFVV